MRLRGERWREKEAHPETRQIGTPHRQPIWSSTPAPPSSDGGCAVVIIRQPVQPFTYTKNTPRLQLSFSPSIAAQRVFPPLLRPQVLLLEASLSVSARRSLGAKQPPDTVSYSTSRSSAAYVPSLQLFYALFFPPS